MKKTLTYILLCCATALWGVSFIVTKELFLTESAMSVTLLITLRLFFASLVTIPSLLLFRQLEPLRKADIKWFLLLAFCEPFIYNFMETSGVNLVSGSLASVVVATIPIFVPFGMAAVYHERVRPITLLGILLSLLGISIMVMGERLTGSYQGLLFLSGAVAIAVAYTLVLVKVVDHYRPFTITAYQNLFGTLYYLPLMFCLDGTAFLQLSWSPKMILLLLLLGIFCSTLAYVCYNRGIRDLGATATVIFTNAIPVFSMIAALAIGQESFSLFKLIGMAIVLLGVLLVQTVRR